MRLPGFEFQHLIHATPATSATSVGKTGSKSQESQESQGVISENEKSGTCNSRQTDPGKDRDPLPADIRWWESGPRYTVALLERRGRSRADAVELVRRWWMIGPTVEGLSALGIEDAGRIFEDAGQKSERGY